MKQLKVFQNCSRLDRIKLSGAPFDNHATTLFGKQCVVVPFPYAITSVESDLRKE